MKNETQVHHKKVIEELKNFIAENIDRNFTLKHLSKKAAVSVYHLSRIFKQAEGITLKKYIQKLKMENSLSEVLYTSRKLNDISFKYGFEDYASFCRGFKRIYKVSPDDLRKIIITVRAKNNIADEAVVCIKPSAQSEMKSELKNLPDHSGIFIVQKKMQNRKKAFSIQPHIIF